MAELSRRGTGSESPSRRRVVSVVGGGEATDELSAMARELGKLLAQAGFIVVTGGRSGVAEAVSRGVSSAGGVSVGLLPSIDHASANPWVSVPIPTGLGDTRNSLVAAAGEVVVALAGGWGTRSEISLAVVHGRPVVLLGGCFPDLSGPGLVRVDNPREAVLAVEKLLAKP